MFVQSYMLFYLCEEIFLILAYKVDGEQHISKVTTYTNRFYYELWSHAWRIISFLVKGAKLQYQIFAKVLTPYMFLLLWCELTNQIWPNSCSWPLKGQTSLIATFRSIRAHAVFWCVSFSVTHKKKMLENN